MAQSEPESLWARINTLFEQISHLEAEILSKSPRCQEEERYVEELEDLNESDAAEYLRSVDDARVWDAFSVLSDRLDRTSLAQICLELLRRPGVHTRLTGAFGIGSCFKGTFDDGASNALLQLIRDPHEVKGIGFMAYTSLEMIHFPGCSRPPQAVVGAHSHELLEKRNASQTDILNRIDWDFVNSFDSRGRGVGR